MKPLPPECWALLIGWCVLAIPTLIWVYRDWCRRRAAWEAKQALPDLVAIDRTPGCPEQLLELLREALPMLMREAERAEAEAKAGAGTAEAEILDFYAVMSVHVVCRVRHALGLPVNPKLSIP